MRARTLPSLTFALLIGGLGLARPAIAAEVPIEKSDLVRALPEPVRKAVLAEGAGALVRAVATEQDSSGATVYEVEMRIKGLTKDIVVGGDGTVLVSEQQMTLAALPPAARASLVRSAAGRRIRIVESVTLMGKLEYYEAHVGSGKTLTEIKVSPGGTVLP